MEVRIWDAEGTTTRIASMHADAHQLSIKVFKNFESLSELEASGSLAIIDGSILPAGFNSMLLLLSRKSPLNVIYVAESISTGEVVELMRSGALAVCESSALDTWLSQAFAELIRESDLLASAQREFNDVYQEYQSLSMRELEVLNQIVEGRTNKEIATDLSISIRTVEARRAKLYGKMRVTGLAQLIFKIAQLQQLSEVFQREPQASENRLISQPTFLKRRHQLFTLRQSNTRRTVASAVPHGDTTVSDDQA